MNEEDAWREIYKEWKQVRRLKKLNQELYDLLFGNIVYIIEYSKKHNIPIPHKEALVTASNRIHKLMDEIEPDGSRQFSKNTQSDDVDDRWEYSKTYIFLRGCIDSTRP